MNTGPSISAAQRMAAAVSIGSAGTTIVMLSMARSQAMSSIEWWVGPSSPYAIPGLMPHSLTLRLEYATSALICSSARAVRKQDAAETNGNPAAVGQSRGHADHVLLGDADIDQPIGEGPLERVELAGADRVVDDADDAMVVVRQLGQGLRRTRPGSRSAAGRRCDVGGSRCRSRCSPYARAISCGELVQCQLQLFG